ncbi:MAG: N-6 DNA methylase [Thiolinea sp.]
MVKVLNHLDKIDFRLGDTNADVLGDAYECLIGQFASGAGKKAGDSLEHPQHPGQRFEAIVANPPFSAHWSANPLFLGDDRFLQYGKLAPKTKADFAFVLFVPAQL